MNARLGIRILAVVLVLTFGLGTLGVVIAKLGGVALPIASADLLFASVANVGFVIGGVGLWKLKRWGLWLTVGLCAVSIAHFLWNLFTALTRENATKQNEMIAYVVVGFYLLVAFVLTSDWSRKEFS